MKKTLSILLSVVILLSSCVFFSSCTKVSEKDVTKEPYKTLSKAYAETLMQIFTDDANVLPAIQKATQKGAVSFSLKSKTLFADSGIDEIRDTVYLNAEEVKMANDLALTFNGEDYSARFFMDEDGLILQSEDLLNQKTAFALSPETLAEHFKTSDLAALLFPEQDLSEIQKALEQLEEAYEDFFDSLEDADESAEEEFERVSRIFKQSVLKQKIDGKPYLAVSYTINNETIKAFLREYKDEIADPENALDEAISQLDESAAIDFTLRLFLNQKTALIDEITLKGSVTDLTTEEKTKSEIDAKFLFAADSIQGLLELNEGEDHGEAELLLKKEEKDGAVRYQLTVKLDDNGEKTEFAPVSYEIEKKSGEFALEFDLKDVLDDETAFVVIEGKLEGESDRASIVIHSIRYDEVTLNLELQLLFEAGKAMPAEPKEPKDVILLTQDEIATLINDISTSKIGSLLTGAQSNTESLAEAV